eukprot:GHRR01031084.1.p3 GENE.GHRR01031084.1~~GHRR01031084.1.p3  ORF type:complete len:231 (-),score=60.83 GHRR01031084.1:3223-3915(-)
MLNELAKIAHSVDVLHGQFNELLDYLHSPGPVTRWLPTIDTIGVQHGRALRFMYVMCKIKQAAAAVSRMFEYKPHAVPDGPEGVALYTVSLTKGNTPLPTWDVHVVSAPATELVALCKVSFTVTVSASGTSALGLAIPGFELGLVGLLQLSDRQQPNAVARALTQSPLRANEWLIAAAGAHDCVTGSLPKLLDAAGKKAGCSCCQGFINGMFSCGSYPPKVKLRVWALRW